MRFGMNTTTRIPKLFLTAQTVNPLRFPLHVPNESIADEHLINIQIFCRKLRFRCQRILCIILFWCSRSGQVHSFMAALTWLHSVETNLTLTCLSPKSFAWTLPDFGRHVDQHFPGSLSLLLHRAGRREPWEWGWEKSGRQSGDSTRIFNCQGENVSHIGACISRNLKPWTKYDKDQII